jgi:spore coat protein F
MEYGDISPERAPATLAWHETLELHELTAFQTFYLIKLKKSFNRIKDPSLKSLYSNSIRTLQYNLRDLMRFFSQTPSSESHGSTSRQQQSPSEDTAFYTGELLFLSKSMVRNYAAAITETATPALRKVFVRHLESAIHLHTQIFHFMYDRQLYPAYNLNQLLSNDYRNAQKAMRQSY